MLDRASSFGRVARHRYLFNRVLACCLRHNDRALERGSHQQLKDAHLAFIDEYTCAEGNPAKWDQANFDSNVAKITQQFADAEAAESKAVPARQGVHQKFSRFISARCSPRPEKPLPKRKLRR